uniref:Uncharacterized protein n=1 Tax=Lactuca sativa TaxID=4236 RepID=A0A9R1VW58_LACSA|nr:hypothetical protein LSAT_V11C400161190 [Lactuca sativa]
MVRNLDDLNMFPWASYLWEFTFDDLQESWNKINNYLSVPEPRRPFKYSVSGFTSPFRIWIYEMFPYARGVYVSCRNNDTPWIKKYIAGVYTNERRKPKLARHKMIPSEEETIKSYYLSCLEYVFGEPTPVPSPVRNILECKNHHHLVYLLVDYLKQEQDKVTNQV